MSPSKSPRPSRPRPARNSVAFGDVEVALTHLDRMVFPDVGIAKGEVIEYYRAVADVMVPELRGRPLSMERFTKSVEAGGFFQKHWQKHYPVWLDHVVIDNKTTVDYPICDSPAGLVYFANQGGVAFHVTTSRKPTLEHPDLIVFDLDPPEGGFELVRRTAKILYQVLGDLGLPTFVKTTGSKGLHVVAPLDATATFDEVHVLCQTLAKQLVGRHPDLLTTEFYKKDRGGRLYFDTGRNIGGATFVAAYSLRGRRGAPVSAPIEWSELDDPDLRADGFRLRDMAARLATKGDPWRTLRAQPGSVRRALQRLR